MNYQSSYIKDYYRLCKHVFVRLFKPKQIKLNVPFLPVFYFFHFYVPFLPSD